MNIFTIEEVREDMVICRSHAYGRPAEVKRSDLDSDDVPIPGQRVIFHDDGRRELVGAAKRPGDDEQTRTLPSEPEKSEEFAE